MDTRRISTNRSRPPARDNASEEVIIARTDQLMVRMTPTPERSHQRIPGSAGGEVVIAPDFDASLPEEILEGFEQ